jgi:hypothetical protein
MTALALRRACATPPSGISIDTSNDRNSFTYTGKTATTLTGCSGVLAHNNGATVIPRVPCSLIDSATDTIRIYADRGDGTIEETVCIGTPAFQATHGFFGTAASSYTGVVGHTLNSVNGAVLGSSGGGAPGLYGVSVSGVGARLEANATRGHALLTSVGSFPSDKSSNQVVMVGGRLYYADGSSWLPLTQPYFESAEQAIATTTLVTVAHGLTNGAGAGRVPKFFRVVIRCNTAEFGFAIGDEVDVTGGAIDSANNASSGCTADATNIYIGTSSSQPVVLNRSTLARVSVTIANWKYVAYAS